MSGLYVAPCKEHAWEIVGAERNNRRPLRCRFCRAEKQEVRAGVCCGCGKEWWTEADLPLLHGSGPGFVRSRPICGHAEFIRCLGCTPGCPVCGEQGEYT